MRLRNPLLYGLLASSGLLLLFLGVLSLANNPIHALQQFVEGWYWILALAVGFGIQVGLYVWLQNQLLANALLQKEVAATATVSGTAMVACCAHHATDLLPLVGIGVLAPFFVQYQGVFIVIGFFSNLLGILVMLQMAQRHNVLQNHFLFSRLQRLNFSFAFVLTTIVGLVTMVLTIVGVMG